MSKSPSERIRAYRARQREAGKPDSSRRYRREDKRLAKVLSSLSPRSFVGCDGEGCGVDDSGRQLYMLFRMGSRELFTGKRLGTRELLDFICSHDAGVILVGFVFSYDATMILRDLPPSQLKRLFEPKEYGFGKSRFTWYKEFDIDYLPRQYLRVRRVKLSRDPKTGEQIRTPIKGSARTIYETFGFFQCSFLKAIGNFDVGTIQEREQIERNKNARSSFETIDDDVRAYCAMECDFLARLMDKLREYCLQAGIVPRTWNGAGKLASALHAKYETLTAKQIQASVPEGVLQMAAAAYYGGRFEITRTGMVNQKVYEYDIRSAYPDAMRRLPCLSHGRWKSAKGKTLLQHTDVFIAQTSFRCVAVSSGIAQLGGFPVRSKDGHLFWPLRGSGVYWSCEIRSAMALGFHVKLRDGWIYERTCDCQTFAWVRELFDYRRRIGSQGPGYPIKLGINSLYGKLAQRIGNPKYANMIWAGLITAETRSRLNDAISHAPADILMLATDGVYSLRPLPLPIGDELGDYEAQIFDGLFLVQPGLYWSPNKRKRKSRGLSAKFFEREGVTESFEREMEYWQARANSGEDNSFPELPVSVRNFTGLKIAVARGKPETSGIWKDELRTISFDYRAKRQGHVWKDGHIVTSIKPGYAGLVSVSHAAMVQAGGYDPLDELREAVENNQDYVDFGPPFED